MPTRTNNKRARQTRPPRAAAQLSFGRLPVPALAMATASRLYSAQVAPDTLPSLAAQALAVEPGQMCQVSLGSAGGEDLRPVAISHARPGTARKLRDIIAADLETPADAFSRTVVRTGGALRMAISHPRQLRLWFAPVYWPYVERAEVSAVLAAALADGSRVFGALLLWRERDHPPFDESDEAYVVSLAARLSLGFAAHPLVGSPSADRV